MSLKLLQLITAVFILLLNSSEVWSRSVIPKKVESKSMTEIMSEMRQVMDEYLIQAYIIPSVDAHQSEYIASRDNRLRFVTDFTGSAGTAIIAETEAALWTDSRYHIQADQQLDRDFWKLMRQGLSNVQTDIQWLNSVLAPNSRVGCDPFLMSSSAYSLLSSQLQAYGHTVVALNENLVDKVWTDRPPFSFENPFPLKIEFSGKRVSQKLIEVRADIVQQGGESMILNALDDIAWLMNMRASDIEYSPVFFSYAIITQTELFLYIKEDRITDELREHFTNEGITVIVKDYDDIINGINSLVESSTGLIIIPSVVSQALFSLLSANRMIQTFSRVALMKSIKNPVEVKGMVNAHARDGAALVRYLHWLDITVGVDLKVTELSAAEVLKNFRSLQENFFSLSFEAISAFGANAALAHYSPTVGTDAEITRNEVYLIDSGGQYFDGTTDVTRTIHLGEPTAFEKEAFTRVLKGFLSLGHSVFPVKAPGSYFDALARKALWDNGLDYGHGTGHGVGAFLGVHEAPPAINSMAIQEVYQLVANQFTSNEPGYYEEGKFGIRIEDVINVVPAIDVHDFDGLGALTFNSATLAPIQTKMIDLNLLNKAEAALLNAYHLKVREIVGAQLLRDGLVDVNEWLIRETEPVVSTN